MSQVQIRRARREDGPGLIAANQAARAYHAPWAEPFADEGAFETWFAASSMGSKVALVVEQGQAIAGVINFNEIVIGAFRSAYLGYWNYPPFAGRGLMTEGLRLAVRFAFDELGLHRLEANIQPGNGASIALVKRLGFRLEGFSPRYLKIAGAWRDHERWAILADDEDLKI